MEWVILVSITSVLITILIFVITTFSHRVKKVDEKVEYSFEKFDTRLRCVEGAVIEMKTENEAIIKRLDRIETKIDTLRSML
jgi:predicted Holliday junction resolvase-like endonuclease